MDQARFVRRDCAIAVGAVRLVRKGPELFARVEDVGECSLASLCRAAGQLRTVLDETVTHLHLFAGVPEERFWPDHSEPLPLRLSFFDTNQVRVSIQLRAGRLILDEPSAGTFRALAGVAARHRVHLSGTGFPSLTNAQFVAPSLAVGPRGRSVNDCVDIADDMRLVLQAALGNGTIDRIAAADLLRAGRPDLLIGQREQSWLDAKRTPYSLDDDAQRFEFSKDVAALANSGGGLIVCGIATRKDRQGDLLVKVMPFDLSQVNRRSLQDTIRRWIHPVPTSVRIELIELGGTGDGIVFIEIPEQPAQVLPLLVHRGDVGKGLTAEHMTLPVRDGEETNYGTIGEIHALLVAGRVATAVLSERPTS